MVAKGSFSFMNLENGLTVLLCSRPEDGDLVCHSGVWAD